VLAVAGIVFPVDHVANAAHLGGMLAGVVTLAGTRRTDWYLSHADGTVNFTSLLRAQEAELRLQAFEFDAGGAATSNSK